MKNKLIIKIIIFSLIITGLVFVYIFCFNFLKNKSQNIADQNASISNQIKKLEVTLETKKQSNDVAKITNEVDQFFLKSSEIPTFLSNLEAIGLKAGSSVNISSVDEVSNPEGGTMLSLNISARGSYSAIYKTLVELENLQYLSNIASFSLDVDQNANIQPDATSKNPPRTIWAMNLNLLIKSYVK